jgi:hypothetical protein
MQPYIATVSRFLLAHLVAKPLNKNMIYGIAAVAHKLNG